MNHEVKALCTTYDTLADTVQAYDTEGYFSMTYDKVRNRVYQQALYHRLQKQPHAHVVEIGTGAALVLTTLVLQAPPHTATLFALEANQKAFHQAQKQQKTWTKAFKQRCVLYPSLSTAPEILLTQQYQKADVILHELLGYLASCEGVVAVLWDIWTRRNRPTMEVFPAYIATCFTPTFFVPQRYAFAVENPSVRLLHRPSLGQYGSEERPFRSLNSSSSLSSTTTNDIWHCGLLETLDYTAQTPCAPHTEQHFTTTFVATGPHPCQVNSLTHFIWAGFATTTQQPSKNHSTSQTTRYATRQRVSQKTPWSLLSQEEGPNPQTRTETWKALMCNTQHAFTSAPGLAHSTSNWPLCCIFLSQSLTLQPQDSLIVRTTTRFTEAIPSYKWHVSIRRGTQAQEEFVEVIQFH